MYMRSLYILENNANVKVILHVYVIYMYMQCKFTNYMLIT